ncbi:type II toxin-antitoxin system prevent-host-death family antitoxin [Deinococcus sp.]|uniref:type II toxin-antitoxin system prevent-host-death family antitoxin n=1 Tax=Deinococcus sp. TaxID=47478 RepID=UPI003B59507D
MTTKTQHRPEWRLEEAKAKFSQVVEQAMAGTPQRVTRRGQKAVVVVSDEQWEAAIGQGPKAIELFRNFPKMTEKEHAEFERNLDRGEENFPDRELDLG